MSFAIRYRHCGVGHQHHGRRVDHPQAAQRADLAASDINDQGNDNACQPRGITSMPS